jgi:hypothetical protein
LGRSGLPDEAQFLFPASTYKDARSMMQRPFYSSNDIEIQGRYDARVFAFAA